MTVGERIKNARKSRKLSQEDLGNYLGIGKSSISEWESGKRQIPMDTLEEIATYLEVSVPHLMGWDLKAEPCDLGENTVSPAAMELARSYDRLSEASQKLISAIVLFESADVAMKNHIIAELVDHHNEKLQSGSSFVPAARL